MSTSTTHDAVLAGMELLRWRYDPAEWDRYIAAQVGAKRMKGRTVAGASLAVGLGTAFGLLVLTSSVVLSGAAATLAVVGAFESVRSARKYVRERQRERGRFPETAVVFTSTGLLFGDDAWLWSGESNRLIAAGKRRGGWPTLILTFGGRFGAREPVYIPVPRSLNKDIDELVALLKQKIAGRQGAPNRVAPRPPPEQM